MIAGEVLKSKDTVYGYGDAYKDTALRIMVDNGWIPEKYGVKRSNGCDDLSQFERENNYPIVWYVKDGLKREMKENVK